MRPLLLVFKHSKTFFISNTIIINHHKMKLSILFTLLPFVLHSYASPEPLGVNLTVGPAPFEELKPQVELFTSNRLALGNFSSQAQAAACGVYFCEDPGFTGNCYWGCYPIGVAIYPDTYWVFRITSVGPDPGARVVAN